MGSSGEGHGPGISGIGEVEHGGDVKVGIGLLITEGDGGVRGVCHGGGVGEHDAFCAASGAAGIEDSHEVVVGTAAVFNCLTAFEQRVE